MNRLRDLRLEKNLTQKDIAKLLNMSQNGYSQYETETTDIPTNVLKTLATFYHVNIDYIMNISNNKKMYSKSNIVCTANNFNRLREIREDQDLYQIEIAKILGMSQTGYSAYETNFCDIPNKVLVKLALYYNVPIDYLLYLTDEREPYLRNDSKN